MDRRRTPLPTRCFPALVIAAATLAGACEPTSRPSLGISTSARFLDAGRLAIEDAGAAGAFSVDTILIPEETNESAPAVRTAERFVSAPGILAVVGHSNSAASLAASQIYDEHGVVQLAPHSSAVVYSRAGPWSFRLVPPDDQQARFLAERVDSVLPSGGRVAVLYVNDDYGRGLLSDFTDALSERQQVVLEYPHTEEDGRLPEVVASTIATLESADPDLLVWLGRGTVLHEYLPLVRDRLPGTRIIGGDALASARQQPNDDGRWDGVMHVDFVDLRETPALREFGRRYQERFGLPASGPDALTYDAVALVLSAVEEGARTPETLREYLLSLGRERPPYEGITGPVRFDDAGDADRSYVLLSIGQDP